MMGDSVGAHFHAPEEWFDPRQLTRVSAGYSVLLTGQSEYIVPKLPFITVSLYKA